MTEQLPLQRFQHRSALAPERTLGCQPGERSAAELPAEPSLHGEN